jgi:hypothetical protein
VQFAEALAKLILSRGAALDQPPTWAWVTPCPTSTGEPQHRRVSALLIWGQYAPGLNASSDEKPPFEMLQKAIENSLPNKNGWTGQWPCSGFQESTMMRAIATHNEPVEFKNIH